MMRCCLRTVYTLLLAFLLQGCSFGYELPPRPANVPEEAVRLTGGKTCWWITCSLRAGEDVCTLFNANGLVLDRDDPYRPYDGGPPVMERDLRIDADRSRLGELRLENGRILLRLKEFDWRKRVLDEERGVRR
jgi:hypothetical protein